MYAIIIELALGNGRRTSPPRSLVRCVSYDYVIVPWSIFLFLRTSSFERRFFYALTTPLLMQPHDLLIAKHDDLWVLDKPYNIPVHPGSKRVTTPDLMTLARDILGAPADIAPIHRLDKHTSGLVLCSPNPELRSQLGQELADHAIEKTYLAMVYGHTHKKGSIQLPLFDQRRKKKLEAITRYKRIHTFGSCTLLEVQIETGRKHQIRRHLQSIKHAIVGDTRYRHHRRIKLPAFPNRLWLHAHKLTIPSLSLTLTCELPPELQEQLDLLISLRESNHAEEE